MVGYIVSKSHLHVNGKVYSRGEEVELDDTLALKLLSLDVVIAPPNLPTESEGLFEELKKENSALKEKIEQQKEIIKRLTTEVENTRSELALLKTKKR